MIRCTIDIEASDVNDLKRIIGPLPPVPPPVARPGEREALQIVCFELATNRFRRNKIEAIKRTRELTGFGLKEAKDAVETLDCVYLFGSNVLPE